MPWSIPNATVTNTAAGTTSVVVNHPGSGSYSAPFVSVLVLATAALTTAHSPTGTWTRLYNGEGSGSHSVSVWVATGANGSSTTISWTTSSNACALWAEFQYNVTGAGIVEDITRFTDSWTTTASGTSHATPSIVIPRDESLIVAVHTTNDTASAGSWSGGSLTEDVDFGLANYPRTSLSYTLTGAKSSGTSVTRTSGVTATGKCGILTYFGHNPSLVIKKYNKTRPIYTNKTRRA